MNSEARSLILWLGLGFAFSSVIGNLFSSLLTLPEQRYVLLPMGLAADLARRELRCMVPRRPVLGSALVGLGLAAEILGVAAHSWFIARLGLPVALLGGGLLLGRALLSSVPLVVAAIPIPDFVVHSTSPGLESVLTRLAGTMLASIGRPLQVGGPLLQHGGERLELLAHDGGFVTAVLLGSAGWYAAVRAGRGGAACLVRSALAASSAAVVQPLLVFGAASTLAFGIPDAGEFMLRYGVALLLAAVILRAEIARSSESAHPTASVPAVDTTRSRNLT